MHFVGAYFMDGRPPQDASCSKQPLGTAILWLQLAGQVQAEIRASIHFVFQSDAKMAVFQSDASDRVLK